jgi:aminopeptidase
MNSETKLVQEGARRIITRNLGMRRGEDVVIVVDETTIQVGNLLAEATRKYEVGPTTIVILQDDQPRFANDNPFPLPLTRALEAAQGVIIAVSDQSKGTGFRVNLLRQSRRHESKVALMPGITLEMVAKMAETDYELLIARCEALRLPLLFGHNVEIITESVKGQFHTLTFTLGGWEFPPTMSSGIVRPFSFDNVPSGEVYVPPVKGTANGEIIINGSVTGYVFDEGDEIKFTFEEGALVNITPVDHKASNIIRKAIEQAREAGDQEPDYLCELGIGVNPSVLKLTGETLLDEKAEGTAHIAIGVNEPFGGDVQAKHIHEDFIFRNPTICIDDILVLDKGKLIAKDRDWRHSFRNIEVAPPFDNDDTLVLTTGVDTKYTEGSFLKRIYFDGTDTESSVYIGDNETAMLAANIVKKFPEDTLSISIRKLSELAGYSLMDVKAILQLMSEIYGLIEIDHSKSNLR